MYEICYKPHTLVLTHLRHVATLPWEIKNSNYVQQIWNKMHTGCIFVASNFVVDPQILIFSVFNEASFPHTGCK